MFDPRKLLIIGGIMALGVLAVVLLVLPGLHRPRLGENQLPAAGQQSVPPSSAPPQNALLPSSQAIPRGTNLNIITKGQLPPGFVIPELPKPQYGASIPSFEDLRKKVASSAAPPPSPKSELLPLPEVADSEVSVDPSGASSTRSYVEFFVPHYADIVFDAKRFESVLKDENKLPLLVPQLVEKALFENNFSAIHDSLLVFQDYIGAKLSFLKSIKVNTKMIALSKEMIAFDKLTLDLIQKTFDAENHKISASELKDFYRKFNETTNTEHNQFLKEFNAVSLNNQDNFFEKFFDTVADVLGLKKIAVAQFEPPFGGMIGAPIFCLCDLGFWIFVGPPVPPATGSLFVPLSFVASPLFFPFKSLRPGAWWLGLYFPSAIPCLEFFLFGCFPIGFGSLILMTGTSI